VAARRAVVTGVSGIVGGAPVAGMADRLMPAAGIEVSAAGVAEAYRDLLGGWLVDERDRALLPRIAALGIRTAAEDTIMVDDGRAEAVARAALDLVA
jgi:LPPG:FO 2-phospho-L-lactate transferase